MANHEAVGQGHKSSDEREVKEGKCKTMNLKT
jgi:hypothetical protein